MTPAQPVFEAAKDGPLLLEGGATGKVQLPCQNANDHGAGESRVYACDGRAIAGGAPLPSARVRFSGNGRLCRDTVKRPGDLFDAEGLKEVTDLDVVEILDAHTALIA